jgi:HEAT repeat protein
MKLLPGYIARRTEFATSHDKMIVESPAYKFECAQKLVKKVRAYGTSYLPRLPKDRKVELRLERLGAEEPLYQAAVYLIKNPGAEEKTAQIMIWAAAEKMSFEELRKVRAPDSDTPYVTGRDYFESMRMLRRAGVEVKNLHFSLGMEKEILNNSEQLRDGGRAQYFKAIEVLGWFYREPRVANLLVEVLEEEDSPVLREKAARVLGGCGLESVRGVLLESVAGDPVKAVRRTAAFSLLMLGDVRAVPLSIMFLGDEDAEPVSAQVGDKLGELTGEEKKNSTSQDWELWWVTKGGWKWLESRGADVKKVKKVMEAQHRFYRKPGEEVVSVMDSKDEEAVLGWLRKLHTDKGREQLEDPEVFKKVAQLGMSTSNASVALNVAWILRSTKDSTRIEQGKNVLIEMLAKKGNRASYRDIISVLAQWKAKEAVGPLLYLIEDKEFGDVAIEALKQITGKQASGNSREEWEKLLSQHGDDVKAGFIKRLKEKDEKKLTQALSDLTASRYQRLWTDSQVYDALLKAAANIKTWEQVNAFVPIITASKDNPRSQRALTNMIEGAEDIETKRALFRALTQHFPNGDTIEYLLEVLDGKERRLRMAARDALYEITDAKAPKRLRTKSDWLEYFAKHPAARWGRQKK